jgi:molybdopterin biosynthesis enzyme
LPDRAAAIAQALREAAPGADLLLLTGGSGQGEQDAGAAAIAMAGRLLCHGSAARPGRTAGLCELLGRPVLLLPGRAEDALAAWWWLARPALRRLAGATDQPPLRLRLAGKVASAVGLAELVPLAADGRPLAVGALPLAALVAAAAILEVPPESEGLPAGTEVEAFPL